MGCESWTSDVGGMIPVVCVVGQGAHRVSALAMQVTRHTMYQPQDLHIQAIF